MLLATRDALARSLGVDGNTAWHERLLGHLLLISSEIIERECHRCFGHGWLTEYLDGAGTSEMVVSRRPVSELISVRVDATRDFDPGIEVFDDELRLHPDSGIVERIGGVFPRGSCNIRIAYIAGYKTIPEDLALACVQLAAQLYIVSDLSAETEALVAPYKNRVPK